MNSKLYLIIIFLSLFFYQCSKNEIIIPYNCVTQEELGVTVNDATTVDITRIPWRGKYSNDYVEINYSQPIGFEGKRRTTGFVLKKSDNCLEFEYAYQHKFGDYFDDDEHATEVKVVSIKIQEWVENKKIVGQVVFTNAKQYTNTTYTKNFWYEFTNDDLFDFNFINQTFKQCIEPSIPVDIDVNNDGINDYEIKYFLEEVIILNTPQKIYRIKIAPLNNNTLLSTDSNPPFKLIFEPPFTSEDKRESASLYFDSLGKFTEYNYPYDRFNHWVTNYSNLYFNTFSNTIEDYIIIKIEKDNLFYYGWIKIKINYEDCIFEVLETYLSPTPNEHVIVN